MGSNDRGEIRNLLKRCRSGEAEAWNEFHQKYGGKIEHWLSITQSGNDRLMQEIYARIAADSDGAKSPKVFESNLRRASYTLALNQMRAVGESGDVSLGEWRAPKTSNASQQGLEMAWNLLRAAASGLSAEDRTLLARRYRDSLSYADLSKILKRDDVRRSLERIILKLADDTQKLRLRASSCTHAEFQALLLPYAEGLLNGDEAEQARRHSGTCPSFKVDAETIKNVSAALWVGYGSASMHPTTDALITYAEAPDGAAAEQREKIETHLSFCAMCSQHLKALRENVDAGAPTTPSAGLSAALLKAVNVVPGPDTEVAATPSAEPAGAPQPPLVPPVAASSPIAAEAESPREAGEQPRFGASLAIAAVLLVAAGCLLFSESLFSSNNGETGGTGGKKKPAAVKTAEKPPAVAMKIPDEPQAAAPESPEEAPSSEKKLAPEKKVVAEKKVAAEKKPAPEKKVAAEKKPAPEKKVAADKKPAPEKKVAAAKKPAPEKKVAAAKKPAPEKKVAAEKKPAPEKKVAAAKKPAKTVAVAALPRRVAPPSPAALRRHQWRVIRASLPPPERKHVRRLEAKGGKAIRTVLRDKPYAVEIGVNTTLTIENVTVTTTQKVTDAQRERATNVLASTLKVDASKVTFTTGNLPPSTTEAYVYRPSTETASTRVPAPQPATTRPASYSEPVTTVRITPPSRPRPLPAPVRPVEPIQAESQSGPPSPPPPTPH